MPLKVKMKGGGINVNLVTKFRQLVLDQIAAKATPAFQAGADFIKPRIIKNTPMEYGDLRNSFKSTITLTDLGVELKLEFTDPKAAWVHEMPATYNYTTPGTGPKFLQRAIDEHGSEMAEVIVTKLKQDMGL